MSRGVDNTPIGCGGPWHYVSHSVGSVCPDCGVGLWAAVNSSPLVGHPVPDEPPPAPHEGGDELDFQAMLERLPPEDRALVEAGMGAGKTSHVLAAFLHRLAKLGVDPQRLQAAWHAYMAELQGVPANVYEELAYLRQEVMELDQAHARCLGCARRKMHLLSAGHGFQCPMDR